MYSKWEVNFGTTNRQSMVNLKWEPSNWTCDHRANVRPRKKWHGKGTKSEHTNTQTDFVTTRPTRSEGQVGENKVNPKKYFKKMNQQSFFQSNSLYQNLKKIIIFKVILWFKIVLCPSIFSKIVYCIFLFPPITKHFPWSQKRAISALFVCQHCPLLS